MFLGSFIYSEKESLKSLFYAYKQPSVDGR